MRIGRFSTAEVSSRIGLFMDDRVYELSDVGGVAAIEAVLSLDASSRAQLISRSMSGRHHSVAEVRLLAPVARPSKVLCIGINYVPHMEESSFERPSEPVVFSKLPSTLIGPDAAIVLPKAAPRRVDYEAEVVLVIGRRGRDITRERALDHVAGYTVGNDVSARDWQLKKPAGQWLLGKSFDTFLPLGPWIVTPDEFGDPGARHVGCRINGEQLQDDVIGSMIFDFATLVAYVSQVATLEPGDLIMTGTPGGVGQSRTPPRWLQDGDAVETYVDGIGTIRNPVRAAST
jgi:2-keto-4-pentenoate hydratase/2-oxohepta-3-ene-1,7-dioic acid hydratase in catechol pathway